MDSVEEGEGRKIWENGIERCKISCMKKNPLIVKIDRLDDLKLKSFGTSRESIYKMKSQPSEWEEIFANHTSNKGLIFKI